MMITMIKRFRTQDSSMMVITHALYFYYALKIVVVTIVILNKFKGPLMFV